MVSLIKVSKRQWKEFALDLLLLAGCGLVCRGLWLIHPAACWIGGGVIVAGAAYLLGQPNPPGYMKPPNVD